MHIKKSFYFIAFMLLTLPIAFAQSTIVSGTLVDPQGNVWSSAIVTAQFQQTPNVPGPYIWSGGSYNPTPPSVLSDSGGNFTITLPSNNAITPSGSTWKFIISPNATTTAAIVNVGLTSPTLDIVPILNGFNAWPTAPIPGTFIDKVYNVNQVGTTPLNVGAMVYNTTTKQLQFWNGLIWQNVGTGGGGGGGTPQGFGVPQYSTKSGSAFFAGSQLNSNAFNISNDGLAQAQAIGCTITLCNILFPDNSVDTEVPHALPVATGSKVSSLVEARSGNTFQLWGVNPLPINGIQTMIVESANYTLPYPIQSDPSLNTAGNTQSARTRISSYSANSFSNGNAGCPLFCPPVGYTSVAQWTGSEDDVKVVFFNSSGIREFRTNICGLYGIGDGQCGLGSNFITIMNGNIAPSDEGIYGWGSSHIKTGADYEGTVTSLTDGNHFKTNATVSANTQGVGRYIRDLGYIIGTDGQPLTQVIADRVYKPGDIYPYGTVVSNTAHFPVSTARGTLTNNCNVPVQLGTVAVGTDGSAGCDITVDTTFGVGHFDTSAAVCTFADRGNLHNLGSQVMSVTNISGGHQNMQMTMNRSIPANGWIYQGGLCPGTVGLIGDGNFNTQSGQFVDGSVFPIAGSPDAHTAIYLRYVNSQVWGTIPDPGSLWGTRDTANTPAAKGFTAVGITRVSNVVSMTITSGFQGNPPARQMLNGTKFFSVTGCSDPSINSVGVNSVSIMPGPDPALFEYLQPGSNPDTSCPSAIVAMQNTTMSFYWGAEVLSVVNPAIGVTPDFTAVDGTFVTSYNPHFAVGHSMDSPPHYEGALIGLKIGMEVATPMGEMGGLNISRIDAASLSASVIDIFNPEGGLIFNGLGQSGIAGDIISVHGISGSMLNSEIAPINGRAIVGVGFPYGGYSNANSQFRTYTIIGLDGTGSGTFRSQQTYFSDLQDWCTSFNFQNTNCSFSLLPSHAESAIPMQSPEFRYENFAENPLTSFKLCSSIPTGIVTISCYNRYIPNTAVVTQSGTAGTTQYSYQLYVNDETGPSFSRNLYMTFTGAAVLNGTNFNNIPCTDLPTGKTGIIVKYVNPNIFEIGNCPNSSTVVHDTGTLGAVHGNNPLIDGVYYYSGGFAATSTTGAFAFTQADIWGSSSPANTITSSINQISGGLIGINGNTIGDLQGSISLKNITISGSCSGPGCTTGTPISLTTIGTTGAATLASGVLNIPIYSTGASGTVTSVGCTSLAPLFTCNVTNPSTTAAISYGLNALANFVSVANVTVAMPTSAIPANTCTGANTVAMAGLSTGMTFNTSFTSNPSATTGWGASGGLVFVPWVTANTLNWAVCNQSSTSITPGPITLNVGAR